MCYDVMNIPYLSHVASLLQVLVPAFTSLSAIPSFVFQTLHVCFPKLNVEQEQV